MDQIRGFQACSSLCGAPLGPLESPAMRDLVTVDMSSKIRIAPHTMRHPNGVNFKCNDHVMEKMDDRPIRKCSPDHLAPREYSSDRPLRSGADLAGPVVPSRGYYTDTERVYQKMHRAQFGEHRPQTHNSQTTLPMPQVRARDPLARQFDSLLLAMPQSLAKDTELPNSLKQRVVLDPGVRKPAMPHVGTNPHKEKVVREDRIRGAAPDASSHNTRPVQVSPHVLSRAPVAVPQTTNHHFGAAHADKQPARREGARGGDEAAFLVGATRTRTHERPQVFTPLPETRKKGKSFASGMLKM